MNPSPLENVLARLENVTGPRSGQYLARCPAHEDRCNSLSVKAGDDGRVLLNCFAGCAVENVVAALGLDLKDLFPTAPPAVPPQAIVATYDYRDEAEIGRAHV